MSATSVDDVLLRAAFEAGIQSAQSAEDGYWVEPWQADEHFAQWLEAYRQSPLVHLYTINGGCGPRRDPLRSSDPTKVTCNVCLANYGGQPE